MALKARKHEVTIVTYYKGNDVPGLNIERAWPLPWRTDYEVGSSRHKLAFDVNLAARSIQVGRAIRPDIIHGHMHEGAAIGSAVARLLRVPLVFDFQGSLTGEMVDHEFLNPDGRFYPWMRRMERIIDRLPDATITSSLRAKRLLVDDFGIDPKIILPIPDCVDTDRFDPKKFTAASKAELGQKLGIPRDRPIVSYLGLLTDYQGTPHILKAAALLKSNGSRLHFLIMGYPNVERYTNMAVRMGVSDWVTFTGRVPYADAPQYLSLGKVAISPKVSTTEGSGKVLNYMAMGLPTVVYDTPVHREYLVNLGIYVPPGDISALAKAISDEVNNPSLDGDLGQRLRQRAIDEYSWHWAGERINNLYNSLLQDR